MKTRLDIILETITDFVRSTVAPSQQGRFDTLTKELETADRGLIAKDIAGLPMEAKKKLVKNLIRSGRLSRKKK
jgi:hypothetical protein